MNDITKARKRAPAAKKSLSREAWINSFEVSIMAAWPRDIIGYAWALMLSCMPVGIVMLGLYAAGGRKRSTTDTTKDAS